MREISPAYPQGVGQVDSDLVVADPLVPPAERRAGRVLNDRLLIVVPGEITHCVQAGEPGDGGKHGLLTLVPAKEPGAAEPADRPQVLADL